MPNLPLEYPWLVSSEHSRDWLSRHLPLWLETSFPCSSRWDQHLECTDVGTNESYHSREHTLAWIRMSLFVSYRSWYRTNQKCGLEFSVWLAHRYRGPQSFDCKIRKIYCWKTYSSSPFCCCDLWESGLISLQTHTCFRRNQGLDLSLFFDGEAQLQTSWSRRITEGYSCFWSFSKSCLVYHSFPRVLDARWGYHHWTLLRQ